MTAATTTSNTAPRMLSAGTIIGDDVYGKDAQKLGEIKELMLDVATGTVNYAVLSFGGFLGMGEKLFAVPWRAFSLDSANKRFKLDGDVARFKDAPGFDKDHWPDMADAAWEKNIHAYYGTGTERPTTVTRPM
ncbi:PRC-barrel domain-containing protein [Denitromonas sp.]|uniref:PRC-barrel domain-containing protein n=1 Tax=Denitromonas sp. TaxID=2734609 RepID=UPI002AFE4BC6|nr:PRC-barrel domain-containing protein [Denitromonas sp.]